LVGWVLVWWRRGRRRRSQEIDGVLDTLKLHVGLDYTEASAGWKRGKGVPPPWRREVCAID
jgi:hypothetical protein